MTVKQSLRIWFADFNQITIFAWLSVFAEVPEIWTVN